MKILLEFTKKEVEDQCFGESYVIKGTLPIDIHGPNYDCSLSTILIVEGLIYICVFVCVWEREKKRERESSYENAYLHENEFYTI